MKDGRATNGGPRPGAGRPKTTYTIRLTRETAELLERLTEHHNTWLGQSVEERDRFDTETMLAVIAMAAIEDRAALNLKQQTE